jgi:replication factor C subunit 2/4
LSKELFGDRYKDRILELNASDERGIQVVRDKIKKYSQKLITKVTDVNAPNFQIVILDEADSMTVDAQSALRRIIEDYTKTTRFCIICNYVSKIIDPIASRCAKYRFSPLSQESQLSRLKYIASNEKMTIGDNILNFLIEISEGDLRRSINLLQSISQLGTDLLSPEILNDVCGAIPLVEIETLFDCARFQATDTIIKYANNFFSSGYDMRQFLIQLNDFVVSKEDLSDKEKSAICEFIIESEISLLEGSTPILKLYDLLCQIRKLFAMN